MGSIFGSKPASIAAPDYTDMKPTTDALYAQANNDQPWSGKKTPGQAQFEYMGQQGLEKTMQAINSTKGIRSSQAASMGNNAWANQQNQMLGQAAIRDAVERDAANNTLANIMLQQHGQKINVAQANQQNQQAANAGMDKMLGMGLTAAGYAFGGPAGGMAAGLATQGMGNAPTNMGANPYAGPAPVSTPGAYNPSRYNMGQGLQLNSGY